MTGLEPLAIFGLVCNVMQVINFTHEVITVSKEIYRDSATDHSLTETAQRMIEASNTLQESLRNAPQPITKDESDLWEIAKSCLEASEKLSAQVNKITDTQPDKKGKAIRAIYLTSKRAWNKRKTEGLEKDLGKCQRDLETRLLVRLCNRQDAISLTQTIDFDKIDLTLRNFIKQYSQGNRKICDLIAANAEAINLQVAEQRKIVELRVAEAHRDTREHTKEENEKTRKKVTDVEALKQLKKQQEKFMGSLNFSGRNGRLNGIVEAHSESFHWLFGTSDGGKGMGSDKQSSGSETDETDSLSRLNDIHGTMTVENSRIDQYSDNVDHSDESNHSDGSEHSNCDDHDWILDDLIGETKEKTWDSFSNWLTSEEKIFWISGKPGCGKSTLMKFLYTNPKTKSLLDSKSDGNPLLLWHFIYLMGNKMQHNIKGLICSLLYQVLEEDNDGDLMTKLFHSFSRLQKKRDYMDWSEKELRDTFFEALDIVSRARPICIFLDGLDEIDPEDGVHNLLKLVMELKIRTRKLCVSSREEQAFQKALSSYRHLRLHNLTSPDMYRFARDALLSSITEDIYEKPYQIYTPKRRHRLHKQIWFYPNSSQILAQTLVEKSNGVFLWVHLALRSIERSFCNGDDRKILRERIEEMPSELQDLYKSMWIRLNKDTKIYRAEAASYFNLVIEFLDYNEICKSLNHEYDIFQLSVSLEIINTLMSNGGVITIKFLSDLVASDLIIERCNHIYSTIAIRTAGLLEVFTKKRRFLGDSDKADDAKFSVTGVRFIHRTAKEFLIETPEGKDILKHDTSSHEVRVCSTVQAWLTQYFTRKLRDEKWFRDADGISSIGIDMQTSRNTVELLGGVQKTLANSTFAKWIKLWEFQFRDSDDGYDHYSRWNLDLVHIAVSAPEIQLMPFVFNHLDRYTSEYKTHVLYKAISNIPWHHHETSVLKLDQIDSLLSQGCRANGACFAKFLFEITDLITSESELYEGLFDKVFKTLQYIVDCGTDMSQAIYVFFRAGRICDESGETFLQRPFMRFSGTPHQYHRAFIRMPILLALTYLAQASEGFEVAHYLNKFLSKNDSVAYSTSPDIIAICKGDTLFWSKHAKKVDEGARKRIQDMIMRPIPWTAKDYDRKVDELRDELNSVLDEILYTGEEPGDLTEYLREIHPGSLKQWLHWDIFPKLLDCANFTEDGLSEKELLSRELLDMPTITLKDFVQSDENTR